MKQDEFDTFLCKAWQQNMKTGYAMTVFIERCGFPRTDDYQKAYDTLIEDGIERVPTRDFWFFGVGVWLSQAYPQFSDAVIRSKDARKIILKWLKYSLPKKAIRVQSTSSMRHTEKVYQAARLGDMIHLAQEYGDPLSGHRTRSPVGKRKA